MKYFTYQLYPIALGASISPESKLPTGSLIGITSDTPYYFYGRAEINDLDCIKEWLPVEVPESEFNFFANISATGSAQTSGSVDLATKDVVWSLST